MKYAILIALLFATPAYAIEESDWRWTTVDTVGQVAITTLLVMDRNQTIRIASNYDEKNPILGKSPSVRAINIYFASSIFITAGVSLVLPKPYRNIFQGVVVGCSGGTVWNNYRIGYSMKF
jgi:hypothetical protein